MFFTHTVLRIFSRVSSLCRQEQHHSLVSHPIAAVPGGPPEGGSAVGQLSESRNTARASFHKYRCKEMLLHRLVDSRCSPQASPPGAETAARSLQTLPIFGRLDQDYQFVHCDPSPGPIILPARRI